jgi:hypothetical protein
MKKHILLSLLLCISCTITKTMEEDTEIKTRIQKRKFYTALLAATNVAMMGVDIVNCCFPEDGPFSQKGLINKGWFSLSEDPNIHQPCECPSGELSCTIEMPHYTYDCRQTLFNAFGDSVIKATNYGTTITRLGLCCSNLYNLYQVQQTLNTQSITAHEEAHDQQTMKGIQGISAYATSMIVGLAYCMDGLINYPRTITVWGLNAVVDTLGVINSQENAKAREEIMLILDKKTS